MRTSYAERLRRARTNADAGAGISQAELARRSQLKSPQAVQYLEDLNNSAQGSKHTATFAAICGVNAHWLATGEGTMLGDAVQEPAARYSADVSAAALAKALKPLPPEIRRALLVLIDAVTPAAGGRTFGLSGAEASAERPASAPARARKLRNG